jgi:DNA polymerase III psi subunit
MRKRSRGFQLPALLVASFLSLALALACWAGGSAPYPLALDSDLFGYGGALSSTSNPYGDPVGQEDQGTLTATTKALKAALSGQSIDLKGLDAGIIRTRNAAGSLPLSIANEDTKYAVTVTVSGDGVAATTAQIEPGSSGTLNLSWNLGSAVTALRSLTLSASYDKKLISVPMTLALLKVEDRFSLSVGAGGSTQPPLSWVETEDEGGEAELTLLAKEGDRIWARVDNRGTNVMRTEGDFTVANSLFLANEAKALSDLSLLYPGFGFILKTDAVSGDAGTYDLTLSGAGGYSYVANYLLDVEFRAYSSLFTGTCTDIAAEVISPDLPDELKGEIALPQSPDASHLTVEPVSEKYTPLVSNVFKGMALSYAMTTELSPDVVPALPVLVSWTVQKEDLQKVLVQEDLDALFADLVSRPDRVRALFERIGLYEHFLDAAVDLYADLPEVTENPDYFFTLQVDPKARSFTLGFRLILLDQGPEDVRAIADGTLGWIVIADGARDGIIKDPLCMASRSGNVPTATVGPTRRPSGTPTTTVTVTGYPPIQVNGGCDGLGSGTGLLVLLPVLFAFARPRRRR